MKIEMGESLFYSWLRHCKYCQLVQTNWKASTDFWKIYNENELEQIMSQTEQLFRDKYGLDIYGKTKSLKQFLRQAECDALGIVVDQEQNSYYAVDVAFHRDGLLYGNKTKTVAKVIEKCIRNAMCVYGYFNSSAAKIIFASPSVSDSVMKQLNPCVNALQELMNQMGLQFEFRVLVNEGFKTEVLDSVLNLEDNVADTTELFLRSHQLAAMFRGK